MTQPAIRRRKVDMPSGIRKKFTAALSMLLVAAILMVGSTYAWFTLSTAPEVKGITTSIGANGNLEIALLNYDSYKSTADDLGIVSNVGDSMENTTNWTVDQANHTWGNLVDLTNAIYGLDQIILNQAALNITNPTAASGTPYQIGNVMLKVARYGNDGRVIDVTRDTASGVYSNGNFTTNSLAAGARAIGIASGLNARDTAFNAALNMISTYAANARNAATSSLSGHGAVLTGMMVKAANADNDNELIFAGSEVAVLSTILTELETANDYVFNAYKQAALAYALSSANANDLSDTDVETLVTAVGNATTDSAVMTALSAAHVSSVPSDVTAILTQYNAIATELGNAATEYAGLGPVDATVTDPPVYTYSYSQVSDVLNAIFNRSHVLVEGHEALRSNKQAIIDAITPKLNVSPIEVTLAAGSGVYYDIANAAGNISTSVSNVHVTAGGLNGNFDANIATGVTGDGLAAASRAASYTLGQYVAGGGSGTNAIETIGSTYGYALDFGFRTNVANSTLRLQQAGIQRVYNQQGSASTNPDTQGTGSYLQFTTADASKFSLAKVKTLAGAIRIVFVVPTVSVVTTGTEDTSSTSTYEIIAMAAVDTTATSTDTADTTTLPLALYNFSVTSPATGEVIVTLGAKRNDFDICDLEKNVAKKITAIVYLDGDVVDNTMVANAAESMSGKLNLQFASSATLVPMENAALRGNAAAVTNYTQEQLSTLISNTDTALAALSTSYDALRAKVQNSSATIAESNLVNAYGDAVTVRDAASPSQDDINDAYNGLTTAAAAYYASVAADKTQLDAKIAEAEPYIGTAQGQAGQTVADELVQAYNAAVTLSSNPLASQTDVDNAYNALTAKLAAYVTAFGG